MRQPLRCVVAAVLTLGVGYVAVDATRRAATFSVFTEGYGVPPKSPPEAFRAAEWNIPYLLGLVVGFGTGVGLTLAVAFWWHIARSQSL